MQKLMEIALAAGAANVGMAKISDVTFSREFRDACAQNICGKYGTCWMCPPDVGDIDEMIAYAKDYENIMVFQSIGQLEDSFDFEGMQEAAVMHNALTLAVAEGVVEMNVSSKKPLVLGAGACHICRRCTKLDKAPCAHPNKAIPSLEAYGIAVSELAAVSGMKYINGENTVTYFGAVLYR
ncbi:MAG: DUF2284 domain-containing protein [Firmicutes bacterium]|nr:DUF2284 domain-containing protein [Bacillota bacterium]